ncbi:isocitrate dehydrogenase (NAD(+)) idh1, partial [Kickxella alabastrina]
PGSRHVAKDIQGRNTANPSALILSSVMMLRHLQLNNHADQIEKAVSKTLSIDGISTPDLGGSHSTTEFTKAVINNL